MLCCGFLSVVLVPEFSLFCRNLNSSLILLLSLLIVWYTNLQNGTQRRHLKRSCRYRGIERSDGAVEATSCPRLSGHRDPTSGDEVGRTSQETGDFFTNNSKKLGLAFQIRPLIKGCLNWLQDEEKAANGGNVTSATPVQSQPKVYDYQVKNYCKYILT